MKSIFVLCFLATTIVVSSVDYATGIENVATFIKKTDCGDICSHVFCIFKKEEECDPKTQVFVPSDQDCYCCDSCVDKATNLVGLEPKCPIGHCATVKCRDVPSKNCFDKGMAFVPKDECSCCDSCA